MKNKKNCQKTIANLNKEKRVKIRFKKNPKIKKFKRKGYLQ